MEPHWSARSAPAHRMTVGLVGYGHIGRLVARRLQGFDVELLVTDPRLEASEPRRVELEELWRGATWCRCIAR